MDELATGDRQLAGRPVQAVDEAAVLLGVGLVALGIVEDPVWRVAEPDRAVGGDDDVVGRVEPRPAEPVHDGRSRPIALVARDPAQAVLAGEDRAVVVERVAVGEVGRLEEDGVAVGVGPAADRVASDVAPQHGVLVWDVDGPLGPDRAAGVGRDRRPVRDETVETRVEDDARDGLGGAQGRRHRRASLGAGAAVATGSSASRCSDRWRPRSSAVLSSDQDQDCGRRRAREGDGHPADQDRHVEDHEPPVRGGHLPADAGPQVLAAADVVQPVRREWLMNSPTSTTRTAPGSEVRPALSSPNAWNCGRVSTKIPWTTQKMP